jgi:hypothetical protein
VEIGKDKRKKTRKAGNQLTVGRIRVDSGAIGLGVFHRQPSTLYGYWRASQNGTIGHRLPDMEARIFYPEEPE